MGTRTEIDLEGEIFPIALLKCKIASESLAHMDELCVRTDDPTIVETLPRFFQPADYRIIQQHDDNRHYLIRILRR